jgi:hypothetical protein
MATLDAHDMRASGATRPEIYAAVQQKYVSQGFLSHALDRPRDKPARGGSEFPGFAEYRQEATAGLGNSGMVRAQNRSKVIVIGAGLSGLNAALLLEEQGFDVQVLEGRQRVGGRCCPSRAGTPESGGTFTGLRPAHGARKRFNGHHRRRPIVPFFNDRELVRRPADPEGQWHAPEQSSRPHSGRARPGRT